MTEEKKTSMAPTDASWKEIMDKKAAEDMAATTITEMSINQRSMIALEKIAYLLEIQTQLKLKAIDPDLELIIPEMEVYDGPDEFTEGDDEETKSDIPTIPRPDNLEDEAATEKYMKDMLKPALRDSVISKVKIEVGQSQIKIRLPWLEDDSYEEGLEWRDLAEIMRRNKFEWMASGRDSHWKADV